MNKRTAVLAMLAGLLIGMLVLTGCQAKKPDSGSGLTSSAGETAESGQNTGAAGYSAEDVTLQLVYERNRLCTLLEEYENIRVVSRNSVGGDSFDTVYYMNHGKIASLEVFTNADGAQSVSGYISSLFFLEQAGRITAYVNPREYLSDDGLYLDTQLADNIVLDGTVKSVQEKDDTLCMTVLSTEPDGASIAEDTYKIDRQTLRLLDTECRHADGNVFYTVEVRANENADTARYLAAWEQTRRITFVYEETAQNGDAQTQTAVLEVPWNWEVLPRYEQEVFCYMDSAFTVPYAYPGDGADYTVYITNAVG